MAEQNCKKCGAPMSIPFGTSVITCQFCGSAMTIEGAEGNWKEVQKHTMLLNKIGMEQASSTAKKWMDEGLLRSGVADRATILDLKLQYVPYWVIPSQARTDYSGKLGGGIAGLKTTFNEGKQGNLGGMFGGLFKAGFQRQMSGGGERTVTRTMERSYNWPVIAVRGLEQYVVDNYQFEVKEKQLFDPGKIQEGEIMNGDVTEAEAKEHAQGSIGAFQEEEAKKELDFVFSMNTNVTVQDGELLHAGIWFVKYNLEGKDYFILVDGSNGKIIKGQRPAFSIKR